MSKPWGGIHPITIRETLYILTSHILCLQFHDAFATHFSPHQFKITTKGGCEAIIHGIICTLDLQPDSIVLQLDIANAFNSVSKGVIFQKLCEANGDIIQLIPFVYAFYAFCFTITITMMVMLWSSHLPWELINVQVYQNLFTMSPFFVFFI